MGQSLAQPAFRTSYHQIAITSLAASLDFGLCRTSQVHRLCFEEDLEAMTYHDPTKEADWHLRQKCHSDLVMTPQQASRLGH